MCMRFDSSVRPLVALLVFLLYMRYAPAVVASLNARKPRTELSCTSCRLVPFLSFVAPSLSLALYSLLPTRLYPHLRYAMLNTNNFFRSVKNFVIDLNIVINMSTAPDTAHQGLVMENGSGGFMGDLVFNGGKTDYSFTVRNVIVNNAHTGILAVWNWGWTFQRVINNCSIGFDVSTGGGGPQPVAAEVIIDATVLNTPIFLRTSASSGQLGGSLVLNNIKLTNIPTAIGLFGGAVLLAGGTTTITSWGQGNIYTGSNRTGTFTQGYIAAANKPSVLLDSAGNIFGRTPPSSCTDTS
ncbi:hypothetical protein B0H14DRAFT_287864 [Mycena olivaceomarginata]|nr:hypothetical protein B0H14DRAFT_287864 [Mycena olivaceomarginata]